MCGIAGILDYNCSENQHNFETVRRMISAIRYRGPDEFGIYSDQVANLGHDRLSIIDLSTGSQPIHNEDQTLWIIYNGEIFNYIELREQLLKQGHRFYTTTDTEVIVHAYEEYGTETLHLFNGQFAFTIWDIKNKILFAARDRLGIRPFFYYQRQGTFIFGSEIKAILSTRRMIPRLDPVALDQIFTFWTVIPPRTVFKEIYQLPPGHFMQVSEHELKIRRYWSPVFPRTGEYEEKSFENWSQELSHLLIDATKLRLRADVPVGAYLSGGLDSSIITSIIKNFTDNPLKTFSISFEEQIFDESTFQKKMIDHLSTDHWNHHVKNRDIGECFKRVIFHTETPMLRTAPAPLYFLSKLVRDNNIKVVLTGEGSDEILAGYNIYKEAMVRRFWSKNPESKMRPLLIQKLYPYLQTSPTRVKYFMQQFFKQGITETGNILYSHLPRWNNTSWIKTLFSPELKSQIGSYNCLDELDQILDPDLKYWHPLNQAQYLEIVLFLSQYLLSSQGDRVAMANSIEGRFPFLDYRVVELCARIPPGYKLHVMNEKYILKKSLGNMLPLEICNRPKQPYRAPISSAFFLPEPLDYVKFLFSGEQILKKNYFDAAGVSALVMKCQKHNGRLESERDNMAVAGILSTQLLDELLVSGNGYDFDIIPSEQIHVVHNSLQMI